MAETKLRKLLGRFRKKDYKFIIANWEPLKTCPSLQFSGDQPKLGNLGKREFADLVISQLKQRVRLKYSRVCYSLI